MEKEETVFTATMAKIYAEQGHFEKAADIYRYLIATQKHEPDLPALLDAVEQKILALKSDSEEKLSMLLEEWVWLLIRQKEIKQLQKRLFFVKNK